MGKNLSKNRQIESNQSPTCGVCGAPVSGRFCAACGWQLELPTWIGRRSVVVRRLFRLEDVARCFLILHRLVAHPFGFADEVCDHGDRLLMSPAKFFLFWYFTTIAYAVGNSGWEGADAALAYVKSPLMHYIAQSILTALTGAIYAAFVLCAGWLWHAILIFVTKRVTWQQVRMINIYFLTPFIGAVSLSVISFRNGFNLIGVAVGISGFSLLFGYLLVCIYIHFIRPVRNPVFERVADQIWEICPACGSNYRLSDYRNEIDIIYCSHCGQALATRERSDGVQLASSAVAEPLDPFWSRLTMWVGTALIMVASVAMLAWLYNRPLVAAQSVPEHKELSQSTRRDIRVQVNPAGSDSLVVADIAVTFDLSTPEVASSFDKYEPVVRDAVIVIVASKSTGQLRDSRQKEIMRYQMKKRVEKILNCDCEVRVYFAHFLIG